MSGRIGALKIAGREAVSPDGSFLSLYIVINGRAVDNDCKIQKKKLENKIQIYL